MNNAIGLDEIKQIEEWTGMKMGNVIFDSDIDNWKEGSSVFDQIILNKSDLIFIIEDDDNNLFGGYFNAVVERTGGWVNDPKSFLFSIKSNGRLNGMLKFDVNQPQSALFVGQSECLFSFKYGSSEDIWIFKENRKKESYCKQEKVKYNGIEKALCGKTCPERFTPQRITVIHLF